MWFVAYSTHVSLNEKLSWPDKVKVHGQVEWRANLFRAVVLIPASILEAPGEIFKAAKAGPLT